MKKTSKILSVVLAVMLVFAMAVPAMAVEITINGGNANSAYSAWKLLDAQILGDNLYKYTVNSDYAAALQAVTGKTADKDIVDYIDALSAEETRDFADAVYAQIKDMDPDATVAAAAEKKFTVEEGYYLIAETATGDAADTISLVMLDTAGESDITVETKENAPTVVKKVKDVNDTTGVESDWQDSADYDIGDIIPFQVTGKVSAKIADYKEYTYIFNDTMAAGFMFVAEKADLKVEIDGTDVTDSFKVKATEEADGTTKLVVFCDDLKKITAVEVDADSEVVLTYYAFLDVDAALGEAGNSNTVYLEYSNDPYYEEKGTTGDEPIIPDDKTGETEEDKVVVFTYKLVVDKIDDDGEALSGAGFTLYKKVNSVEIPVGNEITGVTTFTWTGLDDGEYVLKESTVPAGYNKADDIAFTVEATHDDEAADPALTVLSAGALTATKSTGIIDTDVENNKGNLLPTTGGIGTTIFYIVGAVLVLGAVVLLITKKRMSVEA